MNEWLPTVNGFAAAWLEALARACWQGGLAIGLVWVVCRALPQASPRAKSWLWRLAMLKLVAAFLWPVSIDVPLLPARVALPAQRLQVVSDTPQLVPGTELALPAATSPLVSREAPPPRLTLAGWLLLAWCAGVAASLIRVGWGWGQTNRLRRACRRVDDEDLCRWCAEVARRIRLRRVPAVYVTDIDSQPLLLGPWRPIVVLPASLVANSTRHQLRMMLAHELAHAKRLDLWWGWLLLVGDVLFFFHPLVWLCRAEWRLTQELACDALAVSAAESGLTDYGAMLLETSTAPRHFPALSRSTAVGIVETKTNLERRLKAMKFIRQRPSRCVWAATICLLCVAIVGVLPWRVVGQSPRADAPSEGDKKPETAGAEARRTRALPVAPNQPDRPVSVLQVFSLKYANAEEVARHLQALNLGNDADSNLGARKVTVIADARTNAVIVNGTEEDLQQIGSLIRVLDTRPAGDARTAESEKDADGASRPLAIISPRPGFVREVCVKSGVGVKKGDLLLRLDDREAQGKLNNAVAQLDIAKAALAIQEAEANGVRREYDRAKGLVEKKVVSSDELEAKRTALEVSQGRLAKAQAELRLAEQQVKQAEEEVSLLSIRAPKDGMVTRVRVQAGEYVTSTPGQPLMLIGSR